MLSHDAFSGKVTLVTGGALGIGRADRHHASSARLGEFASADCVAAVWLSSEDAAWVSGVSMAVDGGRLLH
jgi:NAD(P)-dependent dehydrogenase (short-subunit alcohol dehydrogenase family)